MHIRSIFSLSSRFQKEAFGYVKNDLIRNLWMNLEEYFEVKRFWITIENKEKELKVETTKSWRVSKKGRSVKILL